MKDKHFQDLLNQLELPDDQTAQRWVTEQNRRTVRNFAKGERFQKMQSIILTSLNDQKNVPWPEYYNDTLYNFWQDEDHPRGIWRRTRKTSYFTAEPEWETVLDIDRLNRDEDANWSYQDADLLYPDYARALIFLSAGGDACEIREFDLINKKFIRDGFCLPLSKSSATWLDQNTLLLALDAAGDTVTTSGYPRCIRRWQRGHSPQDAPLIFAGQTTDMLVSAWHDYTPGFERTLVHCYRDFHHSRIYQLNALYLLEPIAIPEDASCVFFNGWLIITLNTDWQAGNSIYPAGALVATDFVAFQQGERHFTLLFTPDAHTTLQGLSSTRDHLLLNVIRDVVGIVDVLKIENERWQRVETLAFPDFQTVSASGIDIHSNNYQLISHGFLQPCRLYYGNLDDNTLIRVKQDPFCFDNENIEVTQHVVPSLDGTPVPYFQIAAKGLERTGDHPTLLYGYGGFEVSLTPEYLGATGATWLKDGGVYVVANIRGGGEYGPQWHQAALRQHRYRAWEDFAAIANDLISRGVTCAARLAARGGSNGGLLIGNMLTDYPHLFGALVCEVPLLDMINYPRWLAGSSWIAEYGDPDVDEERQWLQRFSPFHKVASGQAYPPVLFTTGTQDDRVSPAHARKMVARMQQQGHNNVWLYEETDAGHGNAPENSQTAFCNALIEEFLWQMLTK